MRKAVVGLGTNIGDRQAHLLGALDALDALISTSVTDVSRVYETAPVGYTNQADFLNCVALLETELSPRALLGACLGIESALGRVRTFRNAPRVIDIDLLLYEGERSNDPELVLPHPRMKERAFVLCPLRDIFPGDKAFDFALKDALTTVASGGVEPFPEPSEEFKKYRK